MSMDEIYSDHSKIKYTFMQNEREIKATFLNIAQPSAVTFFVNPDTPEGYQWSSVFRTAYMLTKIRNNKEVLNSFLGRLLELAKGDTELLNKNKLMEEASGQMIPQLIDLGFPVKSVTMAPHKLFNPTVSSNELRANPEKYINGPFFNCEDEASFSKRLGSGLADLLDGNPDFAGAQEITMGVDNQINYTKIFTDATKKYTNYDYLISPSISDDYLTINATFYNKNKWRQIPDLENIASIRDTMKVFVDSDLKRLVSAFENIETKEIWYVVNIHADYWRTNKLNSKEPDPWPVLRDLLTTYSNIIIGGDFNLQINNANFIKESMADSGISYVILETPEPKDFNPTYDAIFVGPGSQAKQN